MSFVTLLSRTPKRRPDPLRQRRARGVTIVEAMGVWSIYFLAVVIAIGVVAVIVSMFKASNETRNVSDIYTATLPLKSSNGGYGPNTDLADILVKTDRVSKAISRSASNQLFNRYGGQITVTASSDGMYFTITQGKVPASKCPEMIQSLGGSGSFRSISVGSSSLTQFPIALTDAVSSCGESGDVDIAFASKD